MALEVLEITADPAFLAQVQNMAANFAAGFDRLYEKHPRLLVRLRQLGLMMGIEMVNGEMSMAFARGGGRNREIDRYPWPDEKPPFYSGRIPVDPMGRAWVRRHVEAGEPSTYDVFDVQGNRIGTVNLDHGKRVIGFGDEHVYVVSYDEFDLNYLERYAMPGF